MKETGQKLSKVKVILAIIFMIIFIVIVTNSTKILKGVNNVFVVKNGALSYEEVAEGFVIRDEIVLKGEQFKNGMIQIISDNKKASKGEPIFRYYSNSEDEIMNQIYKLDEEINVALENNKEQLFSTDIISLEQEIEKIVDQIHNLNNLQQIDEHKKKIDEYIYKKTQITGTISEDEYIKSLTKQRDDLKKELENDSEIIVAPKSGTISYRVDGLEEILKTDDFDYLSSDLLEGFKLKVGSIVPINNEEGKIVNNFKCYIATIIGTEKSMEAKIGDKVTIRIMNSVEVSAKIAYIKEEENQRIIVFEIAESVEDLLEYRNISFEIIWWKFSGLKVSNTAIVEENENTYVIRNGPGYTEKILIKVLRQNDTYSIIANYEEEELKGMGYSEKEVEKMPKLKLYDQIILY